MFAQPSVADNDVGVSCSVGHSRPGKVQDNYKQLLPRSSWNHCNSS